MHPRRGRAPTQMQVFLRATPRERSKVEPVPGDDETSVGHESQGTAFLLRAPRRWVVRELQDEPVLALTDGTEHGFPQQGARAGFGCWRGGPDLALRAPSSLSPSTGRTSSSGGTRSGSTT